MGRLGSLASKDASVGGALFGSEPQVGVIKRARFTDKFDYLGKQKAITVQLIFVDEAGGEHDQYLKVFNINDPAKFTVSDDGRSLTINGEDMTPNQQSAWTLFAESIEKLDGGYVTKFATGDPGVLDGLKGTFKREKRTYEIRGRKTETEGYVCTKILGAGAGAGAAASAPGNGAVDQDAVKAWAMEFLSAIVAEKGTAGILLRDVVVPLNAKHITRNPEAKKVGKEIVATCRDHAFLTEGAESGLWLYDAKAARLSAVE